MDFVPGSACSGSPGTLLQRSTVNSHIPKATWAHVCLGAAKAAELLGPLGHTFSSMQ